MVPYSLDLRARVLTAVDAGEETQQEVAARFSVSARWIRKLLARRAATGSIAPEPNRGGRKPFVIGHQVGELVGHLPLPPITGAHEGLPLGGTQKLRGPSLTGPS